MELKVYWTSFARKELKSIHGYFLKHASESVAQRIAIKILDAADKLAQFPEMGQFEDLIEPNERGIRYLISGNYKVLYYINPDKKMVIVIDVFDARMNPSDISRNV